MVPIVVILALLAAVVLSVPVANAAESPLVMDNTAPAASSKGAWTHAATTPGFHGDGYQFRIAGNGSNVFSWPFTGQEGEYDVAVRWTAGPNRATDATYIVKHQGGEAKAVVNQQQGGGSWYRIGAFKLRPGSGQGVVLTDQANGVVVADAVMFTQKGQTAPSSPTPSPQAVALLPTATPNPSTPPPAKAAPSPVPQHAPPGPSKDDPRYFAQTRYAITEDRFWDYFQKRGGLNTFGYPVSNTFALLGLKTQIFQRQIMQLQPDGGVALMNLLDGGLMPYTKINGSTFPAPDPEVIRLHPPVSDPEYHQKALDFVREFSPEKWQDLPVGFYRAFLNTVRYEDAFPKGDGDRNLVSGFSLEIWGLPTSRPTADPGNKGFVYLRFQRGIMHYDDACKCTQALLLADYLKSLLTERGLPSDLLAQAKSSKFLGQYNSQKPQSLNRPQDLPGSDLRSAFRRDPTVTVDAGHGGKEIGSSFTFQDGARILEKDLNLKVARKVAAGLAQAGYSVIETRTTDSGVNRSNQDLTGDGQVTVSDDLQARVDIANNAGTDLFLSIHFNGVSDPAMRGTYVFYSPGRPFADRNKTFAEMAQRNLVKRLKDAGYSTVDRGARTDQSVLGGNYHFYLLGPQGDTIKRESRMPAGLGEALFLTNPEDANALRQDRIVDAIVQAYIDAVREYFSRYEPN
jgi:N-acetylmuramoyl-L-alanine amidase